MSRWAPGAAGRLYQAAVELFVEQGFASTTVPQIAARANLKPRSFFRHFADKREVLFSGEDELPDAVEELFANADPDLPPMQVILRCMQAVAPRFEEMREQLLVRRSIVQSDEGLRERELRKNALLTQAAAQAFLHRGLPPREADIAARLAATAYDAAMTWWLDQQDDKPLIDVIREVIDALTAQTLQGSSGASSAVPHGATDRAQMARTHS